jgi:hypothetical protein
MVRRLKRDGTPFVRVSPEEFRQLSITERASGIAAIFRQPNLNLIAVFSCVKTKNEVNLQICKPIL